MTKQYRDEIDALNDLRHALKTREVPCRLAASGAGWILYAGADDKHAVSYHDQTFCVHEGPAFPDAEDAANGSAGIEADHADFDYEVPMTVEEASLTVAALTGYAARERDMALYDCVGDGPGTRRKRAAYLARAAIAERLAKRIQSA